MSFKMKVLFLTRGVLRMKNLKLTFTSPLCHIHTFLFLVISSDDLKCCLYWTCLQGSELKVLSLMAFYKLISFGS